MNAPYIIAEAAQGYEGDASLARLLVRAAAAAGADAIKFQIVYADDLAVPDYPYYGLFSDLEMTDEDWAGIREEARTRGIDFIGDVFGARSLQLAGQLDMDGVKIHSTCFYEKPLVRGIADRWHRVYLSVGGIPMADVEALLGDVFGGDTGRVTVLYGYQSEPTPLDRNNLLRIPEMRQRLGCDIGFMDHADGEARETVTLSAMALALGATVFEKHITLDRSLELEDYVSALSPAGFGDYVSAIRTLHTALGRPALDLTEDETAYRGRSLKRVVAAADLPAGHVISEDDLAMARSADGTGAVLPDELVGRTLTVGKSRHASISPEDLS